MFAKRLLALVMVAAMLLSTVPASLAEEIGLAIAESDVELTAEEVIAEEEIVLEAPVTGDPDETELASEPQEAVEEISEAEADVSEGDITGEDLEEDEEEFCLGEEEPEAEADELEAEDIAIDAPEVVLPEETEAAPAEEAEVTEEAAAEEAAEETEAADETAEDEIIEVADLVVTAADGDVSEDQNYKIIIHFINAAGETVFADTGAEINYTIGAASQVTVFNLAGYTPTLSDDYAHEYLTMGDGVVFYDVPVMESNPGTLEQYVVYEPNTDTPYKVTTWIQSVEDDADGNFQYVVLEPDVREGTTDTMTDLDPDDFEDTIKGYEMQPFENVVITGDGKAEINIYYNVISYLIKFNLNGGYGLDPIYARFNAPVTIGTPQRAGYTFAGWDVTMGDPDDESTEVPTTMPYKGCTLSAKWTATQNVAYTVVYWYENADNDNSSVVATNVYYTTAGDTVDGEAEVTTYTYTANNNNNTTPQKYGKVGDVYYALSRTGTSNRNYKWWYTDESGTSVQYTGQRYTRSESTSSIATDDFDGRDDTHFTFKEADTVTVNGDGSTVLNVYFTRNEYTITFTNGGNTTYQKITAKYGAYIGDDWPLAGQKYGSYTQVPGNLSSWNIPGSGTPQATKIYTMTSELAALTSDITANTGNVQEYTINYYTESLDGNGTSYGNYTYNLDTRYSQKLNYTSTDGWGYKKIDGFTGISTSAVSEGNRTFSLYYRRHRNRIILVSAGVQLAVIGENSTSATVSSSAEVMFEQPFGNVKYNGASIKDYTPPYPDGWEHDAAGNEVWEFDAWCTDSSLVPGTEVDYEGGKMPDTDVTFFARWKKITHDVKVKIMINDTELLAEVTVPHGGLYTDVEDAPADPTDPNGEFAGWFYKDADGKEQGFDFASMPIRADMVIYAKFNANYRTNYTVQYVKKGDKATLVTPKTVRNVKGLTEVQEEASPDVPAGWYPTEISKSLVVGKDETANLMVFEYVNKGVVPIIIHHVRDEDHNVKVAEDTKYPSNTAFIRDVYPVMVSGRVATENIHRVEITEADIVTVDGENQAIEYTFYYKIDDTKAGVQVVYHWYVNGEELTQDDAGIPYTAISVNEDIGTEYTKAPQAAAISKISGYSNTNYNNPSDYVFKETRIEKGADVVASVGEDGYTVTYTQAAGGIVIHYDYELNVFWVQHECSENLVKVTMTDAIKTNGYNVVAQVASGRLYGGLFQKLAEGVYSEPVSGELGNGLALKPVAGATYYLREPSDSYLTPKTLGVYGSSYYSYELRGIAATANVDLQGKYYDAVGISVADGQIQTGTVYRKIKLSRVGSEQGAIESTMNVTVDMKTAYTNAATEDRMSIIDITSNVKSVDTYEFTPYWDTKDGIRVYGKTTRTVTKNAESGIWDKDYTCPEKANTTLTPKKAADGTNKSVTADKTFSLTFSLITETDPVMNLDTSNLSAAVTKDGNALTATTANASIAPSGYAVLYKGETIDVGADGEFELGEMKAMNSFAITPYWNARNGGQKFGKTVSYVYLMGKLIRK